MIDAEKILQIRKNLAALLDEMGLDLDTFNIVLRKEGEEFKIGFQASAPGTALMNDEELAQLEFDKKFNSLKINLVNEELPIDTMKEIRDFLEDS